MIVDDEKYMRYMLRKALESEGYQIIEANNGKQCLEKCSIKIPDLILLDAMMPEIDGFACCVKLQELFSQHLSNSFFINNNNLDGNPLLYQTPLLIMTSVEDKESVDLAFAVGAMDYITKPIKWAVLRQRVRRILQINKVVKELKQQTETARLMSLIQERIRQSLYLDEVLKTAVDEVRNFLKTDRVFIYKFKPDGTGEVVMESVGWERSSVVETISKFSKNAQDKSADRGHIPIGDLIPYHVEFLSKFQVKANLVVPISKINTEQTSDGNLDYTQQLWGLLIAHHCSTPRKWEFSEMDFIECLAGQLAIAIQQSELYQKLLTANKKLGELANLDSLTKVANRRVFEEYLNREWRRMAREKTPISLILCDVDYFKRYNDTYGHPAGDRCLQAIANVIKAEVKRAADLVARYGGEEFVVVLPQTDAEGGFYIAESIRQRLLDLKLVNDGSQISEFVTMSLGVATTIPVSGYSWGKLIKIADEALYQAKKEGRDRTIIQTF
ncbi:diguanylate cyclase [Okeania sp. SIO3I5]|uniref:GGDEF domain-containing response regulator n=1 Tax=Okeania sp. SIO3I5 TaxID=2607805 RepID=UPI0025D83547|nr:diguanylate cyclase [Okeania sp. SIO3I5]